MNLPDIVRGARAGEAFVFAAGLLGLLLWWKLAGDPGAPQSVREVPGVIAEVKDKSCVVRLDSGQSVRVGCDVRHRLESGTRVSLTVTRYAKGEESYLLSESGLPGP